MATTVAASGTSGGNHGPDAYVERVLREIDERGQSHVARINRESGAAYAFPRTEGPCTLGDPRACLRWKDACPEYIRAPYAMISLEKFHRLIKQEAIEDRIPLLVMALPMPVVWFVVAQNPVPPGQKRFRDLDEIRSDIESPSRCATQHLQSNYIFTIYRWWCYKETNGNDRTRTKHVVCKDQLDKYIAEKWRTSCCTPDPSNAKTSIARQIPSCFTTRPNAAANGGPPTVKPTLLLMCDSPQELQKRIRGRFHHSQMVRQAAAAAA